MADFNYTYHSARIVNVVYHAVRTLAEPVGALLAGQLFATVRPRLQGKGIDF